MTEEEMRDLLGDMMGYSALRNAAGDPAYQKTAAELQNAYNDPSVQKLMAEAQRNFMAQMEQSKGDASINHAMAVTLAKQLAIRFPDFSQKDTGLELQRASDASGNIVGDVHANGTTTLKLTLVGLSLADVEMIIEAVKPFVKTQITWQNHSQVHKQPGIKANFNLQYHAFFNPNP